MYARTPCILVVGSTGSLFRHLRQALREEGYDLLRAVSYSRGVAMAHSYRPDLIVLDMDISGTLSGFDFCTLVRQSLSTPMLAVSAVDDVRQKVRALDEGADDYVTEPWSMDELLARVRALLRRGYSSRMPSLDETILYSYDRTVRMDIARQQVYVDEEPIYLTPKEFHLLYLLLLHAGKVLTHRFLLQQVWGEGYSQESGYLRVCICQLRKKITHDFILTQASVGYLFYDGQERARYGNPGRQQAVKLPGEALHLAPAFQREAI
ncbi:MAG TPA: response regulator transcription factor [Ktedonobacteraceae bacterium]|nr:response regulator transcription factor [Ktedonobacteraceae bacterium]